MHARAAVCLLLLAVACDRNRTVVADSPRTASVVEPPREAGGVRATGLLRAVRVHSLQVPQITGQGGRITLTTISLNGAMVKEGDIIAQFDNTKQLDDGIEAEAKMDELTHQIKQKAAQNKSDAEQRSAAIQEAQADLGKALIQLKKGPVLAEIERLKNEAKAAGARLRVESLQKSHQARLRSEAAALRILELQRDRQQLAVNRAKSNAEKLVVRAPLSGMVALENIWKGGTTGHAQAGDQLWNGQPLMKIFDPAQMEIHAQVGEPDGAALRPGLKAEVRLDAYAETRFPAELISASPVATSAIGSPIKNFNARFRLLANDPRLLPDLSAVVVMEP